MASEVGLQTSGVQCVDSESAGVLLSGRNRNWEVDLDWHHVPGQAQIKFEDRG